MTRDEIVALIEDLKQFIIATVNQATANMVTKEEAKQFVTKSDLTAFETRVEHNFDDLSLQITTIADAHAEDITDHDQRIRRLEQNGSPA